MHAIEAGADFLLLDNWSPEALAAVVPRLREHALLEVSGGVNIDNVRAYAESGVSRISIGALTHSAPAADLALEMLEMEEIDEGRPAPGPVDESIDV